MSNGNTSLPSVEVHKGQLCHPSSPTSTLIGWTSLSNRLSFCEYTRGTRRAENPEYSKLQKLAWYFRKTGQASRAHELEIQYQKMPSKDVNDPEYRRLFYLRYADDFLLGNAQRQSQRQKKSRKSWHTFLTVNLKLELSEEKTLITHAQTQAAKFLGYEIVVQQSDSKHTQGRRVTVRRYWTANSCEIRGRKVRSLHGQW